MLERHKCVGYGLVKSLTKYCIICCTLYLEENEDFRRVYMEAQKEISKILEPERFTADGAPPKGKR